MYGLMVRYCSKLCINVDFLSGRGTFLWKSYYRVVKKKRTLDEEVKGRKSEYEHYQHIATTVSFASYPHKQVGITVLFHVRK